MLPRCQGSTHLVVYRHSDREASARVTWILRPPPCTGFQRCDQPLIEIVQWQKSELRPQAISGTSLVEQTPFIQSANFGAL